MALVSCPVRGGYLSTAGGRQKWLYRIEKD